MRSFDVVDSYLACTMTWWVDVCIAKVLFIVVHVFAVLNGPISPNSGKGNEPNLMKWFGTDVLKTSLPHMPPIPTQGQRVMTVDEIERHTQAVSN